jgi:hypothetical protein
LSSLCAFAFARLCQPCPGDNIDIYMCKGKHLHKNTYANTLCRGNALKKAEPSGAKYLLIHLDRARS